MRSEHYDVAEWMLNELIKRERIDAISPNDSRNWEKLEKIKLLITSRIIKPVIPDPVAD